MPTPHQADKSKGLLTFVFPERVTSTTVEEIRAGIHAFLESYAVTSIETTDVLFELSKVKTLDSMGLNLLFELIKWSENRSARITARVRHRSVHLVLLNVRLDKKVQIAFEPITAVGSVG